MEKFLLDSLFSIEEFAHKSLFANAQMCWDPLHSLSSFFKGQPLGEIEVDVPKGVCLVNPELISIGEGTTIEPGAFIKGPCIIGKECQVRHGAYIRGLVVTGDRCILGHSTEIKGSIFLNDVCAAHFNYVGDSILGNRVNLGAGVKLANLRLDRGEVCVIDGQERIPTDLKKMGAVIGDGGQIGCNAVTNPGTIIGKGAFCHPCQVVYGYISPQTTLSSRS